jgi:peptidoglycan/xylan/chitin deacetylase (PgdA/CDA1 family)
VLDEVARWRPDSRPDPSARRMSRTEMATLAGRRGHSIGAHTVRHLTLPKQSREVIARELSDNRRTLQVITGQAVSLFAYPFGAFDTVAKAEVQAAGFTNAVVCGDTAIPEHADLLTLPRLDPAAAAGESFGAWLDRKMGPRPRDDRRSVVAVAASPPPAPAVTAPKARRALIAGWFSYTNSDFTAGDLLACDLVREWLTDAGIESDVAVVPPLSGVALDRVEPADYTDAIFVCGPRCR